MSRNHSTKKRPRVGFTLIELLVVIAIIALLVSILLPSLKKAKDLTKQSVCASGERTMGLALAMYTADHSVYPRGNEGYYDINGKNVGWNSALGVIIMRVTATGISPPLHPIYMGSTISPYLDEDLRIFLCPSNPWAEDGWGCYGYNGVYVGGHEGGGNSSLARGIPHSPEDIFNPAGTVAIMEGNADDMQPPGGVMWGDHGGSN